MFLCKFATFLNIFSNKWLFTLISLNIASCLKQFAKRSFKEIKMNEITTITAIIGNGGWLLRLINGPHLNVKKIQQHWPEAKHTGCFFKEYGDTCVQYVIDANDALKYNFKQYQQFKL